ncbi:MAG: ABC transporter permease [Eubacteriaceae bacterium]|nr:ABC transporter permease [Eubacteriaceae bacterium]
MTVFKTYLKIVKMMLPMLIMYLVICIAVSVMVSGVNSDGTEAFRVSKAEIVLIDNDDSDASRIFDGYVEKTSIEKELKNNDIKTKQDAIFSRQVDGIITVPKGFGEKLKSGKTAKLEIMSVPDSTNTAYIEMMYNRFIKVEQTYFEAGMSADEIEGSIYNDLKSDTEVSLADNSKAQFNKLEYFFNYSNFGIMSILIYAIGMLSIAFNRREVWMRNMAGGYGIGRINRQIYGADVLLAAAVWLVFIAVAAVMYGGDMSSAGGALMAVNCLVFTVSVLSLAFLLASLVKKKEAVSGIMNCFGLGSSFLCGAFIPQEYLGTVTLNIGKIFPSYWYISNNRAIGAMAEITMEKLQPVLINMAVMLAFAAGFLILQQIVSRRKMMKGI